MSVSSEDDEEKYMAHLDDQEFNYPTEAAFSVELTTKRAVEYLIAGSLRDNVCRCCLAVTGPLSQLDEVLQIEGGPRQYNLSIKDLIASIYPYQITNDLYLPDKICEECIDKAVSSYRFIQQCERSERAIKNCFDHVHQSVSTIDPIERPKSRGRPKIHLNLNTLHAPFETVLEYAEPMINLVNRGAVPNEGSDGVINELECPKCWQEFSDLETLLRHGKEHAKTMWYHCKICGTAFAKHKNYLKHINSMHNSGTVLPLPLKYTQQYKCNECGALSDTYATHLQHCELHKFKEVLACVLYRQTERLCSVCFKTEREMIDLNEKMELFGGYPGLTGEHTPSSMLKHLLPTDSNPYFLVSDTLCHDCLDTIVASFNLLETFQERSKLLTSCLQRLFQQADYIDSQYVDNHNKLNPLIFVLEIPGIPSESEIDMTTSNMTLDLLSAPIENIEIEFDQIINNQIDIKLENEDNVLNEGIPYDVAKALLLLDHRGNGDVIDIYRNDEAKESLSDLSEYNKCKAVTLYECSMCALDFESKLELKLHESEHPDGMTHICRICKKMFANKFSLKCHTKTHEGVEKTAMCSDCGKVFATERDLNKHRVLHEEARFFCGHCNTKYKSKSNLRQHIQRRHQYNAPIVVCDLCGKQFTSKSNLKMHIKGHETKECPFCQKKLKVHMSYYKHVQRHITGKVANKTKYKTNHQCKLCPKRFIGNVALSEHMNSAHLNIRPYVCQLCGKGFFGMGALKGHHIVHTKERPEQCDVCGARFVCKKTLTQHVRLHTGERPYKCLECPEGFVSASRRQEHVQRVHLNMTFSCHICDKKFNQASTRKKHFLKVHGSVSDLTTEVEVKSNHVGRKRKKL